MGCKAITPHLVSLAKRLEGKPFHLVAAHCQRDSQDNVVAYLKSQGLAADAPNVTVTSFGGHPKVKGNGYVPYYIVFDHHGKMVHHHMCGAYHGGDGLKMIEWVDKLLDAAPSIYLGKEPFTALPKLAKKVGDKKLPAALREIDRERADEATPADEKAELDRLHAAVTSYRDRMLKQADALVATNPGEVVPLLKDLQKEFVRTSLAGPVDEKLAAMRDSDELETAAKIYDRYERALKRLEKRPSDKARAKTADKLEKLIADHGDLPVAATIRAKIGELRG